MSSILKGGRLRATKPDVVDFISSLNADKKIALSTVQVNEAHVVALARCGAIQGVVAKKILTALRRLEKGGLPRRRAEDVHVIIEEYVTRRTGADAGGLLHLGKSRNDQVATAIRMTLRNEVIELSKTLLAVEMALIKLAKRNIETVFPGYTHLQPAQLISFGHYLIANCFAFIRDSDRLGEAYVRINLSPMGGAALAGTSVPVDRSLVAKLLGFDGLIEASLDAVGGRDFALEALGVFALIANDLSRLSSDLLLYTTHEFDLMEIPDEFASTSSIMPQKKNADPLELMRAKSAKVATNFNSVATLMHGLTSGYNLDYQEITPILWQSIDELKSCLGIILSLIPGIKVNQEIPKRRYLEFTSATEIANILALEERMPFRTAHHGVGALVRSAISQGKTMREMRQADWQKVLGYRIKERTFRLILHTLDLKSQFRAYRTAGSPAPHETKHLIGIASGRCRELARNNQRARAKRDASTRLLRSSALAI